MSKISKKSKWLDERKSRKESFAKTLNLRISPQKMRLVADQIRGKSTDHAYSILKGSTKKAAILIEKTLKSAVSNASSNFGYDEDELFVSEIYVNEAPVMKRFKARARGRGDRILKRSSHLTVVVKERGVSNG